MSAGGAAGPGVIGVYHDGWGAACTARAGREVGFGGAGAPVDFSGQHPQGVYHVLTDLLMACPEGRDGFGDESDGISEREAPRPGFVNLKHAADHSVEPFHLPLDLGS